jgi:hypothetical protein
MMKTRYRALALPALALCACVYSGCGPANEDLKGESKVAPQDPNLPQFKGYGDVMQFKAQEAAKKKAAPKTKTDTKEAPAPEKTKEAEKTK